MPRHARALARLLDLGLPGAGGRRDGAAAAASPRRYLIHARQQLNPAHGEGLREVAEAYNRASREPHR